MSFKFYIRLSLFVFPLWSTLSFSQNIADFQSVEPTVQNSDFVIPSSHTFQKIITQGETLSDGNQLPGYADFTGYVPIGGNSENGYLSINHETVPGGNSILEIKFNSGTKLWSTSYSKAVDFTPVAGTIANCSGTVTPWNTVISCEEYTSQEIANQYPFPVDSNNDGYDDFGWAVEIDPVTKTVIDKRWALGNFKHENFFHIGMKQSPCNGAGNFTGSLYPYDKVFQTHFIS